MKLEIIETPETKTGLEVSRFKEIKKLVRKDKDIKGYVYAGDTFTASQELADYFMGKNKMNKCFAKIVEEEKKDKEDKTEKKTDKK